jgi:uncharacterized damage-inducible protein DinB
MTEPDEHGRPEPPLAAGETATLTGFLDYQRATLAWKCAGLDSDGLSTRTAAPSMTLRGILEHMALVEDGWFSRSLHGREYHAPWDTVDWKADADWEWRTAAHDSPGELRSVWQEAVDRSRLRADDTLTRGGLGQLAQRTWPEGRAPGLRWVLCHMIEEYARHNGHAGLIREPIDGEIGE